jgi:hypothetical protein
MHRSATLAAALLGCGPTPERADAAPRPTITSVDLAGQSHDPLADARADLLLFVRTDCPISNRYAPELGRIAASLADAPVDVWLVYVDPDESPALIRAHMRDYRLPGTPLRDPEQSLAAHVGVRVTPEAAVFDGLGARVYRGRIDDWYVDYGKNRTEASTHELRDALAALLAGRRPSVAETDAIGCPLPPLP